jgi:hypothetical protein
MSLYNCVCCNGLITLDYRCCGCDKAIHWFYYEGDKEINEGKGHSAHYYCAGCYSSTTSISCPHCSPSSNKSAGTDTSNNTCCRSPRSKKTAPTEEAAKRVKKKLKGGIKKGSKRKDRPASFWFDLCEKYEICPSSSSTSSSTLFGIRRPDVHGVPSTTYQESMVRSK